MQAALYDPIFSVDPVALVHDSEEHLHRQLPDALGAVQELCLSDVGLADNCKQIGVLVIEKACTNGHRSTADGCNEGVLSACILFCHRHNASQAMQKGSL